MEITFKAAPFRSPQTWRIYNQVLVEPYGEHTDLLSLIRISYYEQFVFLYGKRLLCSSFTLVKPTGEEISIVCNDTQTGCERQNYLTLIFAILNIVKHDNPRLKIHIGGIYFVPAFIGIIFLGLGLYVFKNIHNSPYSDGNGIIILLGIIVLLTGAYLFFPNIPWTKKTALTSSEFEAWFRSRMRS